MIPELGQFAISLALSLALLQGCMPLAGLALGRPAWALAGVPLARLQFLFVSIALVLLGHLFVVNDFSVAYVAQNSNTKLPLVYRITAVWGGHEGSLLLWVFMLALWGWAVTVFSRQMPEAMRARVVGVLGLVSAGFILFMLTTSSPFERLAFPPEDGRDLNPLLQDPGLIIHPPMLYMGYVGFSVTFAFAVAALLAGRMDSAWARWARPWTLAAWCFLTIGIALGSWWAYYELGWGGWWFWDPVENASFMPWLAGTALIHSLAVTEARSLFKPWTALLAILTFSLSLLGAFLVRSGVLTSVHAFATDPARGLFILVLLGIAVAGALALYAWRAPTLAGAGRFAPVSRESGILANNIFLAAATVAVLLGTLYPLVLDAFGAGKISVGPPYYNAVFIPLAGIPAALAAAGAMHRWKSDSLARIGGKVSLPMAAAVALGFALPLLPAGDYSWGAALGLSLALWILLATFRLAAERIGAGKQSLRSGGFWGMIVAHAGIGVFVAGVTMVSAYEQVDDVRLAVGEPVAMGRYTFTLEGLSEERGPNYDAVVGRVAVADEDGPVAVLRPEKRNYFAQPDNTMTEAGIAARPRGDLYVSLGSPLGEGAWSARLQVKPFIRLIWGGAALMALGGAIAALDRRYRRRAEAA